MFINEEKIKIPLLLNNKGVIDYFDNFFSSYFTANTIPIRFVVSKTDKKNYYCEVGILNSAIKELTGKNGNLFKFKKRKFENTHNFNVVLVIPTGIGAEIGGHAGDATPVARLIASVCDNLILHPNVVNASDINELPINSLYLEGSTITRLLMGTIGIQKIRSNRILLIIDDNPHEIFTTAAINAANAARASYGCDISKVITLNPPIELKAEYASSGRATGAVFGAERVLLAIEENKDEIDAVAFSSIIKVPYSYHMDYFRCEGDMINPWGGVEAIFTHTISMLTSIPTAHSPMFETEKVANMDSGIVDSRMAAEAVSTTFLQCILKGLQKSPKIITDEEMLSNPNVLKVEDVSCLIIPDGCLGLPTLAALEQGITVIAVKENKNIMKNDLSVLPWQPKQFIKVNSYLEAVGVLTALKEGLSLESLRRPIDLVAVENKYLKGSQNTELQKEKETNIF